MIADLHIDLAMKLAELLKEIWAQADRWNHDAKRVIAALADPVDGTLDSLDKLLVCTLCDVEFLSICPVWAQEHRRISQSRFLAKCRMK